MTAAKITDAQVRRAFDAWKQASPTLSEPLAHIRAALEAALTEPEEIPVSEGMKAAAKRAWSENNNTRDRFPTQGDWWALMYRAMERARRDEAAPCGARDARQEKFDASAEMKTSGEVWRWHRRYGDRPGPFDIGLYRKHRRKDDPA